MDRILDFIVEVVEKNDNIDPDEKEVIRYGLELMFLKALFWCLIVVTGIIMGCFRECVIYNLMFLVIRSYAGGYHSQTRTRCLIQSVITVIIALAAIRICCENVFAAAGLAVIAFGCGFAVWKFAPVDTESRQLDEDEIIRFRKRARITLAIYLIIAAVTYVFGFKIIACSAMSAIAVSGVLVMAEHLKKSKQGETYEQ